MTGKCKRKKKWKQTNYKKVKAKRTKARRAKARRAKARRAKARRAKAKAKQVATASPEATKLRMWEINEADKLLVDALYLPNLKKDAVLVDMCKQLVEVTRHNFENNNHAQPTEHLFTQVADKVAELNRLSPPRDGRGSYSTTQ